MSAQMVVHTRGDPLGSIRRLIRSIWRAAGLEAMFVPTNGALTSQTGSRLIRDPDQLELMNPFKPLMLANTARFVPGILAECPGLRLGIVLRPCELRALLAMAKRDGFNLDNILTICVDCLGTYPAHEYLWRAERKGSSEALADEALQFARQGGIMAYRYRSACQLCGEPDARNADINIGVIGLPVRQYVLLTDSESTAAKNLEMSRFSDGAADSETLAQRAQLISKLSERRSRTHDRVIQGIAGILPADVEALVDQFVECGSCQSCLEACPICMIDFPQQGKDRRYLVEDIQEWLSACAGCGMCEQACPQHQPLSAIFTQIHKELADRWL